MAASEKELQSCAYKGDVWPERFVSLRDLFYAALYEDVARSALDPRDRRLRHWVQAQFLGKRVEHLLVLFGDRNGGLITSEWLGIGNAGRLDTTARTIFQRAFALDASMIILAHNHPSGDPAPSRADITSTIRVKKLGHALGVSMLDHFIVTPRAITSMIDRGCL